MNRIVIAALTGLVCLTAACTERGTAQSAPTATTTSTLKAASSGLESIRPCDLLTEAEVTSIGLEYPGEAKKVATSDGCRWKVSGNGGLSAGIRTTSGVKDLNLQGDKVSEIKIGRFDATKVEAQDGAKNACTIAIGVTQSSSVTIISNLDLSSTDTAAACERADKGAELVAFKLP